MPSDAGSASSRVSLPSVPQHVLDAIYAHARETYPDECCGFLVAPQGSPVIDEVRPCVNEQNRYHALDQERFPRTGREAYYLGGKDLRFLLESVSGERPVKIIYHSHPDVGAYFSAEDTRAALGREPDVIDSQSDHVAEAKLFRWDGGQRSFVHVDTYAGERSAVK